MAPNKDLIVINTLMRTVFSADLTYGSHRAVLE